MSCVNHPSVRASYRCDDCGALLCAECVEEGHRLIMCSLCGELALPIVATPPVSEPAAPSRPAARPAGGGPVITGRSVTTPELRRQRRRDQPYSLGEAFLYVFRGRGLYVFGSYLGLLGVLALLTILPIIGGIACLITGLFVLVVLVLVPGALFSIARTTAKGDNELPDWPDFSAFGERLVEIFDFVVIGIIASLPLIGLLKLADCTRVDQLAPHCIVPLTLGWLIAMMLWVPAFGAVAVFQEPWLALRLDLHVKALVGGGGDLILTAVLATVLIVLGQVLSLVLAFLPLVGMIASAAVGMYGWFTAAHLVGLFYRRRHDDLALIYR